MLWYRSVRTYLMYAVCLERCGTSATGCAIATRDGQRRSEITSPGYIRYVVTLCTHRVCAILALDSI